MGFSNVVLAQVSPPPVPDGPWHMMHGWWGPGGMWLGPIWMILWLAALVAIIVGLVRWLGGIGGDAGSRRERRTRFLMSATLAGRLTARSTCGDARPSRANNCFACGRQIRKGDCS
jgi:uncharacterized membrane protein